MASKRHMRRKACEWKRGYADHGGALSASLGLLRRTGERHQCGM